MKNSSSSNNTLTHFDAQGQAHMVDVSAKQPSHRVAIAQGDIYMQRATFDTIQNGQAHKGDVLGIARIAGIMGAKKTAELIPLCHPIPLTRVTIDFVPLESKEKTGIRCTATAETVGVTGVEMEALTAVQVALLTIYDMCKAIDRGMIMEKIGLNEKKGGKSGHFKAEITKTS